MGNNCEIHLISPTSVTRVPSVDWTQHIPHKANGQMSFDGLFCSNWVDVDDDDISKHWMGFEHC